MLAEDNAVRTNEAQPRRSVIKEAKTLVPTLDLADRLCGPGQMRRVGHKWTARCPLPEHDERTPSFTVYPGEGGWYCYGCHRGGDVVDLAAHAWGWDRPDNAAADLLHEFGYPIPERSRSWYARQERQKPVRDAIEGARIRSIQRRVFRMFKPLIEELEDESERREESEYLWDAAEQIAVCIWAGRRAA